MVAFEVWTLYHKTSTKTSFGTKIGEALAFTQEYAMDDKSNVFILLQLTVVKVKDDKPISSGGGGIPKVQLSWQKNDVEMTNQVVFAFFMSGETRAIYHGIQMLMQRIRDPRTMGI